MNTVKQVQLKKYVVRSRLWNFPWSMDSGIIQSRAAVLSHLIEARSKEEARKICQSQADIEAKKFGAKACVMKKCRLATEVDLKSFKSLEIR